MFTNAANEQRIAEIERRLARLEQQIDMLAGRQGFGDPSARPSSLATTEIEQLIRNGKKIDAIKLYRQQTGLGLKEAKDAIEEMERRLW